MVVAGSSIVVVMPAYNAATTLGATVRLIPEGCVDHVVVVDDASRDGTADRAEELGLRVVRHPSNAGYGANQKTCYRTALALGADVVVLLHPDGQYDPSVIPLLVSPLLKGDADVVLGSRMLQPGAARAGGMPRWKRVTNRLLTGVENRALGTDLTDAHTGYRAYTRSALERLPLGSNSDGFLFDTQLIFQAVTAGLVIVEVAVPTSYGPEASSISLRQGVRYGLGTMRLAARHFLARRTAPGPLPAPSGRRRTDPPVRRSQAS